MAFESVRSYVQLASGLGEMTKARALEAAQGLLSMPVADEVAKRAVQATALADQLLEAAKANRANLLSLVQSEVESALSRADIARVTDVDAAKSALAAVTKELADLRSLLAATGASAVASATRSPLGRSRGQAVTTRRSDSPTPLRAAPPVDPSSPGPSGSDSASTSGSSAPAKKTTAKTTTAKKSASKKSASKKSASKKAATTKSTPTKTPAAKKTAKKTAATKATSASKTAAKKSSPTKTPAAKKTAKKTTTRKASS